MKPVHKIDLITKAFIAASKDAGDDIEAQRALGHKYERDVKVECDRQREANARRNQRKREALALKCDRQQEQAYLRKTPQQRRVEALKAKVPELAAAFEAGYAKV